MTSRHFARYFLALSAAVVLVACNDRAKTSCASKKVVDTPENRETQALRYEKTFDLRQMIASTTANLNAGSAANVLLDKVDYFALTRDLRTVITAHFEADEIRALADFYGSPAGKSILKKFGPANAEMMTVIVRHIEDARNRLTDSDVETMIPEKTKSR